MQFALRIARDERFMALQLSVTPSDAIAADGETVIERDLSAETSKAHLMDGFRALSTGAAAPFVAFHHCALHSF